MCCPGRRDVEVPVRGLEHPGGDGGRWSLPAGRDLVADEPAGRLEVEHGDHRLEQRGVNPLALAGALTLEQRDQDTLGQEDPRSGRPPGCHAHRALAGQAVIDMSPPMPWAIWS